MKQVFFLKNCHLFTKKQLEDECKEKFRKNNLSVEKLLTETVTSNFRVTCENWPVNKDMSKFEQWHV